MARSGRVDTNLATSSITCIVCGVDGLVGFNARKHLQAYIGGVQISKRYLVIVVSVDELLAPCSVMSQHKDR